MTPTPYMNMKISTNADASLIEPW